MSEIEKNNTLKRYKCIKGRQSIKNKYIKNFTNCYDLLELYDLCENNKIIDNNFNKLDCKQIIYNYDKFCGSGK